MISKPIRQLSIKKLSSFLSLLIKKILIFLSPQNILFLQGTALFQLMKELHTLHNLIEPTSLMGSPIIFVILDPESGNQSEFSTGTGRATISSP